MTATTLTASEARANLYRLMDQTAESHQLVTIVGKRHGAGLVSWAVVFAKHAQKDAQRLAASGLNRLVYQALEAEHTVKVLRMWSHYE